MGKSWIAVASAEHVRHGIAMGIMQVCHGKDAPLRRVRPGDRVAYYSPSEIMRKPDGLQSFTAFGIAEGSDIRQVDTGNGFMPFRRNVRYLAAKSAAIRPLTARAGFALSGTNWGARLRFGLIEVDETSMDMIAEAMGVAPYD